MSRPLVFGYAFRHVMGPQLISDTVGHSRELFLCVRIRLRSAIFSSVKMREVYKALPDDRPITNLCVVEEVNKCPVNFTVVSRTHDQDIDADLYKDGFFKRVTRYLCHSKVEGYLGYVVEQIQIVSERDACPAGFVSIATTMDTNQRAFKKKQICFKSVPRNVAKQVVSDIIVLSHSKTAPEGFTLAGEMNGMCVCYKQTSVPPAAVSPAAAAHLPYQIGPHGGGDRRPSQGGNVYPGLDRPSRPAPAPPAAPSTPQHHNPTDDTYEASNSALYQVPLQLNKKYMDCKGGVGGPALPFMQHKSAQRIESEYFYSFSLEQDVLQRGSGP
ncbi:Multivesicular body subunit 12 [Trinorchestia longiramus]|nr:Multivesicular body subunit 12 [Trinorchestia longiramus]